MFLLSFLGCTLREVSHFPLQSLYSTRKLCTRAASSRPQAIKEGVREKRNNNLNPASPREKKLTVSLGSSNYVFIVVAGINMFLA